MLEERSTDKDWQDSDEESSDDSDVEAGFCGPENDSMDRTLSLYSMNAWKVTLAFSPITKINSVYMVLSVFFVMYTVTMFSSHEHATMKLRKSLPNV